MGDEECLAEYVKGLEAAVAYFAPGTTRARERYTASSFIENLRVDFADTELISPHDDPPDIIFRGASFEIKEILDSGRRRHAEYKERLKHARALTNRKDSFQAFTPKDVHISEIFDRCQSAATELQKKYPEAVRADLDLLFYVNLKEIFHVIESPFPSTNSLACLGWRSVSFVMGQRSCCLFARNDAPDFIGAALGRIVHLHPR